MREDPETRRGALKLFGGFGLALVGCAAANTAGASSSADASADGGTCQASPDETAGPYPDKTGMLNEPAFFRQDIAEGKTGVPLVLTLTVVQSCAPVAGAVVEIWHCDKDGNYSEYNDQAGATFLRGLQTSDASGQVKFTTIYPGWYQGRATHIHVEVYVEGVLRKTTQIAFPEDVNANVYSQSPLYTKGQNPTSNAADIVFADGDALELATVSGDVSKGYGAALAIGI
jgi:protocatechuate 3,4-dioxygenase beta subunit